MSLITKSLRVKRTPFTDGVEKAGVKAYTVYNHTLLATEFDSLINDYHHLKQHVQIWDVSCQKQLRVKGAEGEGRWALERNNSKWNSKYVCV